MTCARWSYLYFVHEFVGDSRGFGISKTMALIIFYLFLLLFTLCFWLNSYIEYKRQFRRKSYQKLLLRRSYFLIDNRSLLSAARRHWRDKQKNASNDDDQINPTAAWTCINLPALILFEFWYFNFKFSLSIALNKSIDILSLTTEGLFNNHTRDVESSLAVTCMAYTYTILKFWNPCISWRCTLPCLFLVGWFERLIDCLCIQQVIVKHSPSFSMHCLLGGRHREATLSFHIESFLLCRSFDAETPC